MEKIWVAALASVGLGVGLAFGNLSTVAKERWDGISVCVDHKSRNVFAPQGGVCPGSSTLKRMGLFGADGKDGTLIHSGSVAPTEQVGVEGDFFIDLSTGNLYGPKSASDWGNPVPLRGKDGLNGYGSRGPAGPQGPQGAQGSDGVSQGYFIDGDYVDIIPESESPAVSWSQVINTSTSGLVLEPGHYLVQFSGSAFGAGVFPPSRGKCRLYQASSDADSGGSQNFSIPAGSLEYAPTTFAGTGYIQLNQGQYIVLDCASKYQYNELNDMDSSYDYKWDGSEREQYRVDFSLIRLDDVDFVKH